MVRQIEKLKPHPANQTIYGDKPNKDLLASVKANGILNPILITWNNRIISGHRRFVSAQRAGLKEVPVVIFGSRDENDILEALIESNRQRRKTKAMVAREAAELAEIERQRAQARQEATQFHAPPELGLLAAPVEEVLAASLAEAAEQPAEPVVATVPPPEKVREKVAEKLDISPRTAQDAIALVPDQLLLGLEPPCPHDGERHFKMDRCRP